MVRTTVVRVQHNRPKQTISITGTDIIPATCPRKLDCLPFRGLREIAAQMNNLVADVNHTSSENKNTTNTVRGQGVITCITAFNQQIVPHSFKNKGGLQPVGFSERISAMSYRYGLHEGVDTPFTCSISSHDRLTDDLRSSSKYD